MFVELDFFFKREKKTKPNTKQSKRKKNDDEVESVGTRWRRRIGGFLLAAIIDQSPHSCGPGVGGVVKKKRVTTDEFFF